LLNAIKQCVVLSDEFHFNFCPKHTKRYFTKISRFISKRDEKNDLKLEIELLELKVEVKVHKGKLEITELERKLSLHPSKYAANNPVVVTIVHDYEDNDVQLLENHETSC
jgi:hypothetical protein